MDYGLVAQDGSLCANPPHYRDTRTNGAMEQVFALVPREQIFDYTGLQFMQIDRCISCLRRNRKRPAWIQTPELSWPAGCRGEIGGADRPNGQGEFRLGLRSDRPVRSLISAIKFRTKQWATC